MPHRFELLFEQDDPHRHPHVFAERLRDTNRCHTGTESLRLECAGLGIEDHRPVDRRSSGRRCRESRMTFFRDDDRLS